MVCLTCFYCICCTLLCCAALAMSLRTLFFYSPSLPGKIKVNNNNYNNNTNLKD